MKIIIVGTAHPYRGGLAAFNERLACEYVKEGNDVEIYTFTLQYPSFLFPGKTQYTDSPKPENQKIFRKVNSCNPFNWIKVGRDIARRNPDLVIFAYWMSFMAPCMGTIARVIHRNCKAKIKALVHNMIPHEPHFMDKFLPYYFVNSMDAFMALSRSVVEDINRFDKHNRPKNFSPHPIYDHYGFRLSREEALAQLGLPPQYRYVLFFGIIRPYKGLDILLKSLAIMKETHPEVKLIVAGEFYENEGEYQLLIDKLGIRNNLVLHTHFIPDNQVNLYFSAADMVAQPYKSATQSGVTQIAYHFEKPMLVTRVGGLAEIVPDQKVGYVVEPRPEEIAHAISHFYENNKQQEFEKNVQQEKEKYSWSLFTKTINLL